MKRNPYSINDLIDSYRKYKSNVFYSKNLQYQRSIIADFESKRNNVEVVFKKIYDALVSNDAGFFKPIINKIDFKLFNKNVVERNLPKDDRYISNIGADKKVSIEKFNFFISAPIEIFIIDSLWSSIVAGAYYKHNHGVPEYIFGNKVHSNLFKENSSPYIEDRISFKSLHFYERYYPQYLAWKNEAINEVENQYDSNNDCYILTLDFTSFYYSVSLDFGSLFNQLVISDKDYNNFAFLHNIVREVYKKYSLLVSKYFSEVGKDQTIIPIGLLSSGLIANIYLKNFDEKASNIKGLVHYGRYVDDTIFVIKKESLNTEEKENSNLANIILESLFKDVFVKEEKMFRVIGENKLSIKEDTIKLIYFDSKYPRDLIDKLKSTELPASEANLYPDISDDFKSAVSNIFEESISLKVRDADTIKIDSKKLMTSIQGYLFGRIGKSSDVESKKESTELDKVKKNFEKNIDSSISGSVLLDLKDNWFKLMFFENVVFETREKFSEKILKTINELTFSQDEIEKLKTNGYLNIERLIKRFKSSLVEVHNIAKDSVAAITNVQRSGSLSYKLRNCNMIDYSLINLPLINYYNINMTKNVNYFTYDLREFQKVNINDFSLDEFKIKFSPSFIHFNQFEFLQLYLRREVINKHNTFVDMYEEYKKKVFVRFSDAEALLPKISFDQRGKNSVYTLISIDVDSSDAVNPNDTYIGLANIDMSKHELTKTVKRGKKATTYLSLSHYGDLKFKKDLIRLLRENTHLEERSYQKKTNTNEEVSYSIIGNKFLIFPETFLEYEWLPIVEKYSRKTKTVVVTGIKYFVVGNRVYNFQATIIPYTISNKYTSTVILLREKNDYAPFEKEIVHNNGYKTFDSPEPLYFLISLPSGIKFAPFICYELTDIYARSLFKNSVDFIVACEFNQDIIYFSNVIESTSRELFAFVAQVNSSNYGDTKIVAPYHEKDKTLISISGGLKTSVHKGKINISNLRTFLSDFQNCNTICNYQALNEGSDKLFKKPSARSGFKK